MNSGRTTQSVANVVNNQQFQRPHGQVNVSEPSIELTNS